MRKINIADITLKNLSQPGQFACNERVTIETAKANHDIGCPVFLDFQELRIVAKRVDDFMHVVRRGWAVRWCWAWAA